MERLKIQRKEKSGHEQLNTLDSSLPEQATGQVSQVPIPNFAHNFADISVFAPEHAVQRKATSDRGVDGTDFNLSARIQSASGTGTPLEKNVQAQLETGIGADLSGVRVHDDSEADQLSRQLHANAFTTGDDIFFRQGLYNPSSGEGMRLLAHEATHTVQQASGAVDGVSWGGGVKVSEPNDRFEQAAAHNGDQFAVSSKIAASQPKTINPKILSSSSVVVQRDPSTDGTMVFPDAQIKGSDPNVIHLPIDKINKNDKDEESRIVKSNIAHARTRAIAYLEGSKTEVMMAVDTFKGHANIEIEALSLDPSSVLDLAPILLGAVGTVVSGCFPPAAAIVIAANLAANVGKNVVVTGKKEETAALKLGLKQSVYELGEKIKNAQSAGIMKLNAQLSTQLNELAATDRGVWDLLKGGDDLQLDNVLSRLSIRDPLQNSPFNNVLKAMMSAFGAWKGKLKYQDGMTGFDKLLSETLPGKNRELRSAEKAGEQEQFTKAQEMIEQHEKGSTQN